MNDENFQQQQQQQQQQQEEPDPNNNGAIARVRPNAAAVAPSRGRSLLAIEDEAEWYRRHGLPVNEGDGAYYEWYGGSNLSETNQQEARQRVEDEQMYQAQLHQRFFQEQDEDDSNENGGEEKSSLEIPQKQQQQRQKLLEGWKSQDIILQVQDGKEILCNLKALATHSDTVYAMARSFPRYNNKNNNSNDTSSTKPMSMSLGNFSYSTVESFLKILHAIPIQTNNPNVFLPAINNNNNNAIDYHRILEVNHPEYIIDYCHLAHYLQCTELLEDGIIPILIRSVDSSNCMSLCQLADQFHIPSLLEVSMNHMMQGLGRLQQEGNEDLWNDISPELRNRITTIQGILQSSNRRQLYFSSFTEYLAMFAEQVDYYQERLVEAKIQQEQHCIRKTTSSSSSSPQEYSAAWQYAQSKIEQQQERVRVLKLVLKEQKKLFGNKDQ